MATSDKKEDDRLKAWFGGELGKEELAASIA